jgi:TatD DNase family protein
MIDSHTHLDSCEPPNAELVAQARAANVKRILTIGTEQESCRSALAAAAEFGEVFAGIGLHPNSATGFQAADADWIAELAADDRCRAVGETGFDYYRDNAPPADQLRAFEAQIEIARAVDKPLVIHTRAADDDSIATLRKRAGGVKVILHCFSMPDRLEECLAEGWFISFAGNVTYKSAPDLAVASARVPDDRIVVETDAPYLTPQIVRKERNRPEFVAHTARFVAQCRDQSYEQFEALVEANAAALFRW